jgi:hypothetical protein
VCVASGRCRRERAACSRNWRSDTATAGPVRIAIEISHLDLGLASLRRCFFLWKGCRMFHRAGLDWRAACCVRRAARRYIVLHDAGRVSCDGHAGGANLSTLYPVLRTRKEKAPWHGSSVHTTCPEHGNSEGMAWHGRSLLTVMPCRAGFDQHNTGMYPVSISDASHWAGPTVLPLGGRGTGAQYTVVVQMICSAADCSAV